MRPLLHLVAVGLTTIMTASAIPVSSDPLDGTWDLDVAASTFNPGPGRKSDTRIYKVDGNAIQMIGTAVFVDGTPLKAEFTAAFDGKDYPAIGNPRAETIAQVRVDKYTSKTTTKRGGKVTATSTRQVSKDGKTLTITTSGTDQKGIAFNNILVFRKRESQ
jgi:hypothetical protein